jgi:hypothetical protein
MVEKIECCERSHAQLEHHSHQLRQELETQKATHTQQNAELRSVLQDSQAGLKHLMCEKVCSGAEAVTRLCKSRQSLMFPVHFNARDSFDR